MSWMMPLAFSEVVFIVIGGDVVVVVGGGAVKARRFGFLTSGRALR